jgi:hypothetical protein
MPKFIGLPVPLSKLKLDNTTFNTDKFEEEFIRFSAGDLQIENSNIVYNITNTYDLYYIGLGLIVSITSLIIYLITHQYNISL